MLRHLAAQAVKDHRARWVVAGLVLANEVRGLVVVAAVWRAAGGWRGVMRLAGLH